MKNEINPIMAVFENMLHGHPWFGRNAEELLSDVDPAIVYSKHGNNQHSICDILWHMNAWADFTLNRMNGSRKKDVAIDNSLDWRKTGPKKNNWEKGLQEFSSIHGKIIALLHKKDDNWLAGKVEFREYDFKYLLNGLIQHNIYHLGQIVFANKMMN